MLLLYSLHCDYIITRSSESTGKKLCYNDQVKYTRPLFKFIKIINATTRFSYTETNAQPTYNTHISLHRLSLWSFRFWSFSFLFVLMQSWKTWPALLIIIIIFPLAASVLFCKQNLLNCLIITHDPRLRKHYISSDTAPGKINWCQTRLRNTQGVRISVCIM